MESSTAGPFPMVGEYGTDYVKRAVVARSAGLTLSLKEDAVYPYTECERRKCKNSPAPTSTR